ncbi:hypothetical protein RJT62_02400 [Buchnera aphidicola (Mindarus keteleerifoliae)]|uniref:hypothetical protein n=1 Tax=Buchnera aphidicola TaxID=9 RepID=UPI0031B6C409
MINKKKILDWIVVHQKIVDFKKLLFLLNLKKKSRKDFLTAPILFIKKNDKIFHFFNKKKS